MRSTAFLFREPHNARHRRATIGATLLLVVCAALALPAAAQNDGVTRAPSGVTYVTGGIGTDAVDRLKSMEKDFNLNLVFARTTGEYLSDVKVSIADAAGHAVLDVVSQGPWVMAKLPEGSYRIDATFGSKVQSRTVAVGGSKLVTVDLRWPPG